MSGICSAHLHYDASCPRCTTLGPDHPPICSRWRHVKRGSTYMVRCICIIEATMATAVAYQCERDGVTWVRPLEEFADGRFERIAD